MWSGKHGGRSRYGKWISNSRSIGVKFIMLLVLGRIEIGGISMLLVVRRTGGKGIGGHWRYRRWKMILCVLVDGRGS